MTYTNVNAILVGLGLAESAGQPPHGVVVPPFEELRERYGYLFDDFRRMYALFDVLRRRREQRGSIDFDLPEAEVMLGESGDIEAIRANERNVAHRLIEEFMLAANETVAVGLVFANQPGLFGRKHELFDQSVSDVALVGADGLDV